jgi:chromosomal replication initiation ATPase DnaA
MTKLSPAEVALCRAVKSTTTDELTALLAKVSDACGVSVDAIRGDSTARTIAFARQTYMFIALERGFSSVEIGRFLGRDHTTVLHGAGKIRAMVETKQARPTE